jgi:hypothetical protein
MDKEVNVSSNINWKNMPRKEAVDLAVKLFNFEQTDAEFYVSIARGEIETDPKKQKNSESIIYY